MTPLIFISGSYGRGIVAMETFVNVITYTACGLAAAICTAALCVLWTGCRKPPRD